MEELEMSSRTRITLYSATVVVVLLLLLGSYTYSSKITLESGVHTYD